MNIYRFKSLLKQTLWGGDKIIPFKHLSDQLPQVGESWEISGVAGNETIVADGPYQGRTLTQLLAELKERLVGRACYQRYGNEFPLLIKFIDARKDLSIQVHPTDEMAQKQGKPRGKTEMWYLMQSEPTARLRTGLKTAITPATYKAMVADDTICEAIAEYAVHEGDCFFLPAGRIHSIGAGCFLAEIQQTSDVTYRIYDFNRRDSQGNLRQLHTREAAACIDYTVCDNYRTDYRLVQDERQELVSCPYFTTAVYDVDTSVMLDYSQLDSFVILIGVKGQGVITADDGTEQHFRAGETLLIPATATRFRVTGTIRFLETR